MTSVTELEGVGPAIESDLDSAGFRCLEQLAHANIAEVAKVDGVTPDLVLVAQTWLANNEEWSTRNLARNVKRQCWCRHCGKHFDSLDTAPLAVHERRCSDNGEAPERFR